MSFLLTQFGHGDEAYLPVVELALAVNREMERRQKVRYRILVPWLYGERQRRALNAIFEVENQRHPGEILLDERLGRIFSLFLSNDVSYAASVAMWVAGWEDTGRVVRDHFNQDIVVTDLSGQLMSIGQPNIALELNRAPWFHLGLALAYQVTFCRQSQLFEAMETAPPGTFVLGPELTRSAHKVAAEIERNLCRTYVSVPGTFTPPEILSADTLNGELIAPAVRLPLMESITVPPSSIYVTVSDTWGADENLRSALTWGVPVFTNDPERLGGGHRASPGLLKHPNIQFHFARAEWKSACLSLIAEKPLLVSSFDPLNDPEIHFNIQKTTNWRLAHLHQDEPMERRRANLDAILPHMKTLNANLQRRFGTLDGTALAARRIVDDLLK